VDDIVLTASSESLLHRIIASSASLLSPDLQACSSTSGSSLVTFSTKQG
jgi:hypothetical protein